MHIELSVKHLPKAKRYDFCFGFDSEFITELVTVPVSYEMMIDIEHRRIMKLVAKEVAAVLADACVPFTIIDDARRYAYRKLWEHVQGDYLVPSTMTGFSR